MDFLLALGLLHVVAGLVWSACVLVLAFILLAARRDDDATHRALAEVAHLERRVLRPAILGTMLTGLVLAAPSGLLGEASVVLSTLLAVLALVVGATVVSPRAGETVGELALATSQGVRARDLALVQHPYPTYSDGAWNAAIEDLRETLAARPARLATSALLRVRRAADRR